MGSPTDVILLLFLRLIPQAPLKDCEISLLGVEQEVVEELVCLGVTLNKDGSGKD